MISKIHRNSSLLQNVDAKDFICIVRMESADKERLFRKKTNYFIPGLRTRTQKNRLFCRTRKNNFSELKFELEQTVRDHQSEIQRLNNCRKEILFVDHAM